MSGRRVAAGLRGRGPSRRPCRPRCGDRRPRGRPGAVGRVRVRTDRPGPGRRCGRRRCCAARSRSGRAARVAAAHGDGVGRDRVQRSACGRRRCWSCRRCRRRSRPPGTGSAAPRPRPAGATSTTLWVGSPSASRAASGQCRAATTSRGDRATPSPTRNPRASSRSCPGVRIVTVNGSAVPPPASSLISRGSSTARVSGRSTRAPPVNRATGRRAVVVATAVTSSPLPCRA